MNTVKETQRIASIQELVAKKAEIENAICELYQEANHTRTNSDYDSKGLRLIADIQCACLQMLQAAND